MENTWPSPNIFRVVPTSPFHEDHSTRPSASHRYTLTVASQLNFWLPDQVVLSEVHCVGMFPKRYSPKGMVYTWTNLNFFKQRWQQQAQEVRITSCSSLHSWSPASCLAHTASKPSTWMNTFTSHLDCLLDFYLMHQPSYKSVVPSLVSWPI